MANRPYITAAQVRRSVLRRRQIEAQKRQEAEQEARRRSSRTTKAPDPKTSTTQEA
jgi:hypothetical protein